MSMMAYDAGSKYIVKASNLDEAYAWLEERGEYAHMVGKHRDCVILSADGFEDMFCGNVGYGIESSIREFMLRFCERGSYACHHIDDYNEYVLYYKDEMGCFRSESRVVENPFAKWIAHLEQGLED